MGYTHYWYRPLEIDPKTFMGIVDDFAKLLEPIAKSGIHLAGWDGHGLPAIDYDEVRFNGAKLCGHDYRPHSYTWPLQTNLEGLEWTKGALKRECFGDCSNETFAFPRTYVPKEWEKPDENGLYFDCCKTRFKPYDVAVTAFLIVAKHHLGSQIIVKSDGGPEGWMDAKRLCQQYLGYGLNVKLDFELPDRG